MLAAVLCAALTAIEQDSGSVGMELSSLSSLCPSDMWWSSEAAPAFGDASMISWWTLKLKHEHKDIPNGHCYLFPLKIVLLFLSQIKKLSVCVCIRSF